MTRSSAVDGRILLFAFTSMLPSVESSAQQGPTRTILAIGAHAGDMELTAGAVLLGAHRRGDRVVVVHLTLGEGGNPALSPQSYGAQKRREATAVAAALGAELMFGPYHDGELPNDESTRRYVADVIRQVHPTYIFTHWRESIHRDHTTTSAVVQDAVLLAGLAGVVTDHPPFNGVRGLWYTDNWEDATGFSPFIYLKVSEELAAWREAVSKYEFVHGAFSGFQYLDYYTALATVRGAMAHRGQAVAFGVDPYSRRRVLDSLPP